MSRCFPLPSGKRRAKARTIADCGIVESFDGRQNSVEQFFTARDECGFIERAVL
jgi:hypothetical protein